MKVSDITIGSNVRVRFGSAIRPAVVTEFAGNGKVHVRFTDVDMDAVKSIPVGHRGNLFGATVRPNAIQEGEGFNEDYCAGCGNLHNENLDCDI